MRPKWCTAVIGLSHPLTQAVFEQWIDSAISTNEPWQIWGNPIRLGPTKMQIYGVDLKLWQPVSLEFSDRGLTIITHDKFLRNDCETITKRYLEYIRCHIDADAEAYIEGIKQKW